MRHVDRGCALGVVLALCACREAPRDVPLRQDDRFQPATRVPLQHRFTRSFRDGGQDRIDYVDVHAQISIPADYADEKYGYIAAPCCGDRRPASIRVGELPTTCEHPVSSLRSGTSGDSGPREGGAEICVDLSPHLPNAPTFFVRRNIPIGEFVISCEIELWPHPLVDYLPGALAICNSLTLLDAPEVDATGRVKFVHPLPAEDAQ